MLYKRNIIPLAHFHRVIENGNRYTNYKSIENPYNTIKNIANKMANSVYIIIFNLKTKTEYNMS